MMPRELRRVAVYCGSSNSVSIRYRHEARDLGGALAQAGIGIVYGGGGVGLMDDLATGCLNAGGEVIGVITEKLMKLEVGRIDLTELHVVKGMHARKLKMSELSDAFIALPGGFGTLDELFEAITWTQLNIHHKPVALLDSHGFYTHLLAFLDRATRDGFIRGPHRPLVQHHTDVAGLLDGLRNAEVPIFGKWVAEP
jgi:uncharacterized protein (TIGR00730 family)